MDNVKRKFVGNKLTCISLSNSRKLKVNTR